MSHRRLDKVLIFIKSSTTVFSFDIHIPIVNTVNKVKSITFPTIIKLKKIEIKKKKALLDIGSSKNLLCLYIKNQ